MQGVEVALATEGFVLGLGLGEVGLAVLHEAVVEAGELVGGGGGGLSGSERAFIWR